MAIFNPYKMKEIRIGYIAISNIDISGIMHQVYESTYGLLNGTSQGKKG